MEINKRLFTRNGKVFGNSTVINKYKSESQKKLDLYDIKDDCGKITTGLTSRYIRYCFYLQ